MLTSELITETNLNLAVKIQNIIFPLENAEQVYKYAVAEMINKPTDPQYKYFLVKDNSTYIGLWGIYREKSRKEAWLGWFGVLPQYRGKGYGEQIFKIFENYAINNNYQIIRLYTDEIDNANACKLYEKMGMIKEYYNNKHDINKKIGKIVIYSKSLTNKPVKLWNNKNIHLNSDLR